MEKKKKYIITIEEMISKPFEVFAEDLDKAMEIAIKKYNSGEFVLDPGNLVVKQMEIHDVIEDTYTEWIEF